MSISPSELSRLQAISIHEKELSNAGYLRIAGIDEAGRGPLAGPVVAAACILGKDSLFAHLNDSKQLTAKIRERLYLEITNDPVVQFGIGIIDVETIDRINILQATLLAMQKAVQALKVSPDCILIDGKQAPCFAIRTLTLIKGDSLSISIAAASILAKVTRDRIMDELDYEWPHYGFKKHKGYGTEEHLTALAKFGPCPIHRKSFEPIKSWILKT